MKNIKKIVLISVLLIGMIPLPLVQGYDATVNDFNRLWYDAGALGGFNKNGDGSLVLATTYMNNTLRTIDRCSIEFHQEPFYFGISFVDVLERDNEGNIIEPKNGYFYLRKAVVQNFFPDDLRELASKNLAYKTIEYAGDTWFQLKIPDFNRVYEWGTYNDPSIGESWYTWGNKDSIRFQERAMLIKKIKETMGSLEFDITHNSDKSGQQISISKTYLESKGITRPIFETDTIRLTYTENNTHYQINPPHFSPIGIHEANTGSTEGYILNKTIDSLTSTTLGYYNNYTTSRAWNNSPENMIDGDDSTYASVDDDGSYHIQRVNSTNYTTSTDYHVTKVELRHKYYAGAISRIYLEPYFENTTNSTYLYCGVQTNFNTLSGWYEWVNITNDPKAPDPWYWSNVTNMTLDVWGYGTVRVYEVQIRVTMQIDNYTVLRTIGLNTETNQNSNTSENPYYYTPPTVNENVTLVYPVSNSVTSILNVTNNTCGTLATHVNQKSDLLNNTYWYDAANQYVYIRTINLTPSSRLNWTVNCSYATDFYIEYQQYANVGEPILGWGRLINASGNGINTTTTTCVYDSDGNKITSLGIDGNMTRYVDQGNFDITFGTNTLSAGVYTIQTSFTSDGVLYTKGFALYLSVEMPSTIKTSTTVIVRWYNTNLGLGLPDETLQLYIDEELQSDLNYQTQTGKTLNVTVKDYYENTLYQNDFTINKDPYPISLGLTFHEYDFTNMNEEYYVIGFLRDNASRWYELVVPSRGHEEFLVPTGNYTIRVYNADNSTYTSWNETVNSSKGYTIDGNTITEMIEGLSVVTGQILELQNDIDYALMPDEILWSVNPISVCSAFDKYGMMLGANVWKVCPPKIVVATTRNNTYAGNVSFIPLIPDNDSSGDGAVSVKEDILYLSGTATYVNITYSDNGTSIQNTTYVPSIVHLPVGEGLNITVNCSNDIFMLRETTYSQNKKFYWDIWNSTNNQGYIPNRGGYHRTSIDIVNSLNTSLYNVRVLAGFSNKTTPDLSTARVTDVHNDVITDDQSDDFKTTGSGIEFQIDGGLPATTTRNFILEYYGEITSNYVYSDVQREILPGYDTKVTLSNDNQFYNFEEIRFHNDENVGFKGDLLIRFNIPMTVDSKSIKVQDMDNDRILNGNEFIPSSDFVQISNDAIGTVSAGGVRTFGVYWQEDTSMISDPGTIHLDSVLFNLMGIFPFTPFIGVCLVMMVPIGAGAYNLGKKRRWDKKSLSLILFGLLMIAFFFMLQALGY